MYIMKFRINLFLNYVEKGYISEIKLNDKSQLIGKFSDEKKFIIDNPRRKILKNIYYYMM